MEDPIRSYIHARSDVHHINFTDRYGVPKSLYIFSEGQNFLNKLCLRPEDIPLLLQNSGAKFTDYGARVVSACIEPVLSPSGNLDDIERILSAAQVYGHIKKITHKTRKLFFQKQGTDALELMITYLINNQLRGSRYSIKPLGLYFGTLLRNREDAREADHDVIVTEWVDDPSVREIEYSACTSRSQRRTGTLEEALAASVYIKKRQLGLEFVTPSISLSKEDAARVIEAGSAVLDDINRVSREYSLGDLGPEMYNLFFRGFDDKGRPLLTPIGLHPYPVTFEDVWGVDDVEVGVGGIGI